MVKIKNFWQRFHLSIAGRVQVAKTFMLSQIGYLGCILNPNELQSQRIRGIIADFVKGKLQTAKEKFFLSHRVGGLGMIDPDLYITALQATWVKRAHLLPIDNWSIEIFIKTCGNPLLFHPNMVNERCAPILFQLSLSWVRFLKCYNLEHRNLDSSFLLYNPNIRRSNTNYDTIGFSFFSGNIPALDRDRLAKLKICDVSHNLQLKQINEICESTGLPFSLATYLIGWVDFCLFW